MDKSTSVLKLQSFIDRFSQISYKGAYLWKYLEYELTSGIIDGYQELEKNSAIAGGLSDDIPDVPQELIQKTGDLLQSLEQKDILFGMIPLRRPYRGKLEHTAMDAYISCVDQSKYAVLEMEAGQDDAVVLTKNRIRYDIWGVVGYYGMDQIDRNEILAFLVESYIYPLEKAFNIKVPKAILIKCVFKASSLMKQRKAFICFFEDVLDRVKPKVVCYTHGPDPFLCFLREAAQNKGIPSVEIEHGGIIRNLIYPKNLSYSDYYLTHSDILTRPMIENGIQNVYTVGKPGVYSNTEQIKHENMPVVVNFISSLEPGVFEQAICLAERLEGENYLVSYKLHSSEYISDEEKARIVKEHHNFEFIDGVVDVRDVFAISDIVIGMRSSGVLDALPYHKIKVLALNDSYEQELLVGSFRFFHDLEKLGDIIYVDDKEQVYQEVISYCRGKKYRNVVNHYWPEDATKRFLDFMQIFLDGKRP